MTARRIIVNALMTEADTRALEGTFINFDPSLHRIIDFDADVYHMTADGLRLLFHYRKGIIPTGMLNKSIEVFKSDAVKASSIRGKAGGAVEPHRVSSNVDHVVSPGKFRTKIVYKDGTQSKYYVSNKINSLIAGYFDKPTLARKHKVLTQDLVPCRTTAFTQKHINEWQSVVPMIQMCDSLYQKFEPETHKEQVTLASLTPSFQIGNTAFSTLTVNYNWRTACHIDAGDYHNGYSVILVAEEGHYRGGYLCYPRFGICVDVRHGDFLLKDPHQYHCNTELYGTNKDWTRLSIVMYYRENMQRCQQSLPYIKGRSSTTSPIKQVGGSIGDIKLVDVVLPKRAIDMKLYIRPETTDEKVIKEVLATNVYEKPSLDFYVESGEVWLDLGGNIGTFSLLALSHGAFVVTCEPEADNLLLLKKNLEYNFPKQQGEQQSYEILPVAVTTGHENTVDLFLCKGDYNKYRHTIYHKRGRSSISVKQMNIHHLLSRYRFDCIKMDIEGAEIDILEYLTAADYEHANIHKLVFEYSFDIDPSIPRFLAIIKRLREYFSDVSYSKVKDTDLVYKHFPAATMVYCKITT